MKYYHRHLPHFHPSDGIIFTTFRLADSLPSATVANLRSEYQSIKKKYSAGTWEREVALKKYLIKFDRLLDDQRFGHFFLVDERIASIVQEAIVYRDGKDYQLLASCIMPNHVHLVVRLSPENPPFIKSLQSLKRNTSLMSNVVLKRNGAFWQHESFDHVIRNQNECSRIIKYVLENPVKAGLVQSVDEWKWNLYKEGII